MLVYEMARKKFLLAQLANCRLAELQLAKWRSWRSVSLPNDVVSERVSRRGLHQQWPGWRVMELFKFGNPAPLFGNRGRRDWARDYFVPLFWEIGRAAAVTKHTCHVYEWECHFLSIWNKIECSFKNDRKVVRHPWFCNMKRCEARVFWKVCHFSLIYGPIISYGSQRWEVKMRQLINVMNCIYMYV